MKTKGFAEYVSGSRSYHFISSEYSEKGRSGAGEPDQKLYLL
ncbi:MAG: hypothetical protein LUH19_10095 [Lachnospiraceae bacterium]|nr:hypothetical protein [Lachnospiraceae bacterium]